MPRQRVAYKPSATEREFLHAAIAEYREAARALQVAEKQLQTLAALIRRQQMLPDDAAYSEADEAFVVTEAQPSAT